MALLQGQKIVSFCNNCTEEDDLIECPICEYLLCKEHLEGHGDEAIVCPDCKESCCLVHTVIYENRNICWACYVEKTNVEIKYPKISDS